MFEQHRTIDGTDQHDTSLPARHVSGLPDAAQEVGDVVAHTERRRGPLRVLDEVRIIAVAGEHDTLHGADRAGFLHARDSGVTCGVVAALGRYLVVELACEEDPDGLRLLDGGPQLVSWCRPDGIHPLMRVGGATTLIRRHPAMPDR